MEFRMRIAFSLVALLLAAPAFAQDAGETAVMAETTRGDRFPDADVAGANFQVGTEVTVLFVMGDRLRVRRGDQYGWIPKANVVPAVAAVPALDIVE
jgi:hypothetical protein